MREGQPIPPKIANAPDLRPGLELYFSAFLDLMTSRGGTGDGPISWLTVMQYARAYEFDEEQTNDLIYHISRMDQAHMKWIREKAPKNGTKPR